MKKLLFGILTFLGIGLSFCSADDCFGTNFYYLFSNNINGSLVDCSKFDSNYIYLGSLITSLNVSFYNSGGDLLFTMDSNKLYLYDCHTGDYIVNNSSSTSYAQFKKYSKSCFSSDSSSCEDKSITVYYNSGNSESILCDGTQAIQINGLSTITSTNTFTPYYNISYTDEDNQKLIESYSKDILYLENGQFKKTFTGDNERILTDITESPNSSFSGYLPIFEITGSVDPNYEFTGNVFNNFADNSLKFLFSNIPSYIQYFIIIVIFFLIIGFVKKFRRK